MALFHYGEAWKRFNGLMSFTELAVESSLQLSVQIFVVYFFVQSSGRKPTFWQIFTIATSGFIIILGAGKAVVISTVLPNDNPKRRVIRKVRNVIWNVIFLGTSFGAAGIIPLKAIIVGFNLFKTFTTLYKLIFIALWSIQLFYFIFMCIFVLNNHLEKSQQPWLKCILLSVYHFYNCIPYGITFFVLVPLSSQHNFSILANVTNIVNCQFLVLFYLYNSFTALKFRDVLNLEVMESRHKCPVPNLLFIISLFPIVLGVSTWFFAGMIYSD